MHGHDRHNRTITMLCIIDNIVVLLRSCPCIIVSLNPQIRYIFFHIFAVFHMGFILETSHSNWVALLQRGGHELTVSPADRVQNTALSVIRRLLLQNLIIQSV